MDFAQKLDAVMNITNTSNSTLSMNVMLDASLISRFRRGKRIPSKSENYLERFASYFSKRIVSDYQKAALCEFLSIPVHSFPKEDEKVSVLIHKWFTNSEASTDKAVDSFIDSFQSFRFKKLPEIPESSKKDAIKSTSNEYSLLYGVEGKQALVLSFLSLVKNSKTPQTLYLFSDEDFSWLAHDHAFASKWAVLMAQVILQGNKIVIIHTVNRSTDEMFAAIREWLPLYMSGAIKPYYYPKTRDGVFRRTLFVAPDTAAVVSSTIGANVENNATFLYTDKTAISSFLNEFNDYLRMCRPLMQIFTKRSDPEYFKTFSEFENEFSDTIIRSDFLSSITMPYQLFCQMASAIGNDQNILDYQKKRTEIFENSLSHIKFYEIITMPDFDVVREGKMKAGYFDIYSDRDIFYTSEQFIAHLENIIRLLKQYKNYSITIDSAKPMQGSLLYAKDNVGVLVAKTSSPSAIFAINENNLIAAFWDYLALPSGKVNSVGKAETIKTLEWIISKIKF